MSVTVSLPDKTYTIAIESDGLRTVGDWLANLWTRPKKVAILTDTIVGKYYLEKVTQSIVESGFDVCVLTLPVGETTKSLSKAEEVLAWLSSEGLTRSDGLVALGGGVIGDLTGFIASTYMRGISFVQVPTSLLAQVDSSVGGKTAVNCGGIKNLVGTFYQPDGVLIDPLTLKSLPLERVSEGLAEVIKMAAILDKELWVELSQLSSVQEFLDNPTPFIAASCRLKTQIVQEDERESGRRLLLNFGHTLAHGIEATTSPQIAHGQAVAIGMYQLSKRLAARVGTPDSVITELREMLTTFNLPITMPEVPIEPFIRSLKSDKKNRGDQIKLVYLQDIGNSQVLTLPISELEELLRKES